MDERIEKKKKNEIRCGKEGKIYSVLTIRDVVGFMVETNHILEMKNFASLFFSVKHSFLFYYAIIEFDALFSYG